MASATGPVTGSNVTFHMLAGGLPQNQAWDDFVGTGKLIADNTNRLKHVIGDVDMSIPGDPVSLRPYGEAPIRIARDGEAPVLEVEVAYKGDDTLHKALQSAASGTEYLFGRLTRTGATAATLNVCTVTTSGRPVPVGPSDDTQSCTFSLAITSQVYTVDDDS